MTTTDVARKPRPTKSTAKAIYPTVDTSPRTLDAYVGTGDLALEKLREVSADWPEIAATLSAKAIRLQEALTAVMARLHADLGLEQVQDSMTVELLRELPEPAEKLRALEDHAMALSDQATDLCRDLTRASRWAQSRP